MTARELNLVKWAVAETRHQLGDRVAPGQQDSSWTFGPEGVKGEDAREIRAVVSKRLGDPHTARQPVRG